MKSPGKMSLSRKDNSHHIHVQSMSNVCPPYSRECAQLASSQNSLSIIYILFKKIAKSNKFGEVTMKKTSCTVQSKCVILAELYEIEHMRI